jgi:hypothetical protein
MWESFAYLKWDPSRRTGFLDDNEYNYATPLLPVMEVGWRWRRRMRRRKDRRKRWTSASRKSGTTPKTVSAISRTS